MSLTQLKYGFIGLAFFAGLLISAMSLAEETVFQGVVNDAVRVARTPLVKLDDVDYVSLVRVAEQLGGVCALLPARVQVDLAGESAYSSLNDTIVTATRTTFSLRRPILRQGSDILIAANDVAPFFSKAFRIALTQQSAPAAAQDFIEDETLNEFELPPEPKAMQQPLTIVIDPGHGGDDAGIESASGIKEKNVALKIALEAERLLKEQLNIQVVLTRRNDEATSPVQRANTANQAVARAFISIHAGASFSGDAHGFELFVHPPSPKHELIQRYKRASVSTRDFSTEGKALADTLAETIVAESGATCRGVRQAPCRLLSDIQAPTVLLETGVLTNTADEARLADAAYLTQIAQGIVQAIRATMLPETIADQGRDR